MVGRVCGIASGVNRRYRAPVEVLDLVRLALPILGVRRGVLLDRDVGPGFRVFRVEPQPLFQARLGIGLDRINRAFRFADPAADAFVGWMTSMFAPS